MTECLPVTDGTIPRRTGPSAATRPGRPVPGCTVVVTRSTTGHPAGRRRLGRAPRPRPWMFDGYDASVVGGRRSPGPCTTASATTARATSATSTTDVLFHLGAARSRHSIPPAAPGQRGDRGADPATASGREWPPSAWAGRHPGGCVVVDESRVAGTVPTTPSGFGPGRHGPRIAVGTGRTAPGRPPPRVQGRPDHARRRRPAASSPADERRVVNILVTGAPACSGRAWPTNWSPG